MPYFDANGQYTFVNTTEANTWRDQTRVMNLLSTSWLAGEGANVPGYFAGLEYDLIFEKNPWVYAAVRAITRAAVQLPVRAYSIEGDDYTQDLDSPHALLAQSPTRECNTVEFWDWIVSTFLIHGRTCCYIERLESGKIGTLRRIHPARLQWISSDPLGLNRDIAPGWYILANDGGYQGVDRSDLLIITQPSTRHLKHALSPLEPLRETIENDERARLAMSALWRNGGRPSFVLKHPGNFSQNNPTQVDGLASQFQKKHGGVDNWGAPLILEEGMDAHPLKIDDGIDYSGARKLSRDETIGVLGVMGSLIGVTEGSTYSNVSEAEQSLYRRVIPPYMRAIEGAWQHDIVDGSHEELKLPNFADRPYIEFWADGVLRGDATVRSKNHSLAIQNGWKTPNDVRREEGLPPVEGGDELLINQALAPIDELTQQRVESAAQSGTQSASPPAKDLSPSSITQEQRDSMLGQLSRLKGVDEVDFFKLAAVLPTPEAKGLLVELLQSLAGADIKQLREGIKKL